MSEPTSLLVNMLMQSALVLTLAAGVTLVSRKASAATRHLIWTLSVMACLALPLLHHQLPAIVVVDDLQLTGSAAQADDKPMTPQPVEATNHLAWAGDEGSVPAAGAVPSNSRRETSSSIGSGSAAMSRDASGPESSHAPEAAPMTWRGWLAWGLGWLPWVWAIGSGIALLPLLAGWASLLWLRQSSTEIRGGSWRLLADELSRDLGLRRRVTLLQSRRRVMPMTWSLAPLPGLRPHVLIPQDAHGWTAQRRRVVLLHELAHVRRLDCLTQTLTQIACALFWVNPLMWYAAHRMLIERELACDDLVLAHQVKASDYADHLLQIVADRPRSLLVAQAGIAIARRHALTARIAAMLDDNRHRRSLSKAACLSLATLFGLSAMGVSMLRAQAPSAPTLTPAVQPQDDPAPARKRLTLGPVVQVTFDGRPAYLNFKRQAIIPMDDALARTQADGRQGLALMREHGIDAVFNPDEPVHGLAAFDMLLMPLGRHDHLDIEPTAMLHRLDELGLQAATFTPIRADVPLVHLFRTRQGVTGLLRIVSISQQPKRLVVAFRVLGDRQAEVSAEAPKTQVTRKYSSRGLNYALRDQPQRIAPRTLGQDNPAPADAIVLNWPIRWWSSHWAGANGNTPLAALTMTPDRHGQASHPRMVVSEPDKRKVWVKYLDMPIDTEHYPLLVMTYRARNVHDKSGRYALYLDDGSGPDYGGLVPVKQSDLIADGQVHTLTADLRITKPIGPIIGLALGLHAPPDTHASAQFELLDLRFESLSPQPVAQPTWPMRVRVTDEHGEPLPGAAVTLHAERRNWMTTHTTDEHGHVTLPRAMLHGQAGQLPVAPKMLRVEAQGRLPIEVRDLPTDPMGNLVNVRMVPALPMRGRVVDAEGKPVPGAIVRAAVRLDRQQALLGHWGRLDAEAVADEQGRWTTAPLPILPEPQSSPSGASIRVQAHHPDHPPSQPTMLLPGQTLASGALDLLIAPSTQLVTLDVRDEHGQPFKKTYWLHDGRQAVEMQPDMTPRLSTPVDGSLWMLSARGYPPQLVRITPDDIAQPGKPIAVTLDKGKWITVTLIDNQGRPMPGVAIQATALNTTVLTTDTPARRGSYRSWRLPAPLVTPLTSDSQGQVRLHAPTQTQGFLQVRIQPTSDHRGVHLDVSMDQANVKVHVPSLQPVPRPDDGGRPADYDPSRIFRAIS